MSNGDGFKSKQILGAGGFGLIVVLLVVLWRTGLFGPTPPPSVVVEPKGNGGQEVVTPASQSATAMTAMLQEIRDQVKNKKLDFMPELEKMGSRYESIIRASQERISALESEIKNAQAAGNTSEAEQLAALKKYHEDALNSLKAQIEQYKKDLLDALAKNQEPTKPPTMDISPPPPETGEAGSEEFKKLLAAAAAALCVVQPEFCWVVALLGIDVGLFSSTENRQAVLDVARKALLGQPITEDDLKKLAAAVAASKNPSDVDNMLTRVRNSLPPEMQQKYDKIVTDAFKTVDDVNRATESSEMKNLRAAVEARPESASEVLKALPQVEGKPQFSSDEDKRRAAVLCKSGPDFRKYWDELSKVDVKK
jgi:small-conductance mechanosensitive channel